MKQKCIDAVQAAAKAFGRSKALSAAEIQAIDDKLASTMRYLARNDEHWQKKSADQRVIEASTHAMEDMTREAARRVQNAQLQIVKRAAIEQDRKSTRLNSSHRP